MFDMRLSCRYVEGTIHGLIRINADHNLADRGVCF
jgi:hypothetical protein